MWILPLIELALGSCVTTECDLGTLGKYDFKSLAAAGGSLFAARLAEVMGVCVFELPHEAVEPAGAAVFEVM